MHRIAALALAGILLAWHTTTHAQTYPCRTLTIVVPFPAGSTTDAVARILADGVAEATGSTVVIDNKPGAEGQIAAVDVMRAPPDGCRVLLGTSGNLSVLPFLRKQPPFDTEKDFTPIADVGRYTYFLFVTPDLPATNLAEFVKAVKERPGQYNYATGSNTNLLAFSFIKSRYDLQMERVIYRGEPPAMTDLLAGRVHAMVATTLGVPHVREGKLRALAVMLDQRSEQLPDVPTFAEAGLEGFSIVPWLGVVGPAKLDPQTVAALSAAFLKAMDREQAKSGLSRLGFALTPAGPAAFAKLIHDQGIVYERRIREVGLTVE